jgi:hypothetical protein
MAPKEYGRLLLYTLLLILGATLLHEATHTAVALICGVPLSEIRFGFYGINPSVTFPAWFTGTGKLISFYAGGIIAGIIIIPLYFHFFRKYRIQPRLYYWPMGLVTILFIACQFGSGYVEGRYHAAYIAGANSVTSATCWFVYLLMVLAICWHFTFFPLRKMESTPASSRSLGHQCPSC